MRAVASWRRHLAGGVLGGLIGIVIALSVRGGSGSAPEDPDVVAPLGTPPPGVGAELKAAHDARGGEGPVVGGVALAQPEQVDPATAALRLGAGLTAAEIHESTLRDMQEVYADEVRLEPWASEREAALRDHALADLLAVDPQAEVSFDCRASSCRIRMYSTSQFLTDEMAPYPFPCVASLATADLAMVEGERQFADVYVLFGEDNLSAQAFGPTRDLTCPAYRSAWQERVRQPYAVPE